MFEPASIAVRCLGVVLPAVAVLWVDDLRGGAREDGYGAFLTAAALALATTAIWAARDATPTLSPRVVLRWVLVPVLVGVGLGLVTAALVPDADAGGMAAFYGVPLLLAAGVGVVAARRRASP